MNELSFFWKVLIALCAGIFGLALAFSIQHIRIIGIPKWVIGFAVLVQLFLSWGVFIFVMIFFKSGFLPEFIPNDEYSALSVAYFCATIPHIITTTAVLIYDKEVNRWLESRYGSSLPSMSIDKYSKGINQSDESNTSLENESSSPHTHNEQVCPSCDK